MQPEPKSNFFRDFLIIVAILSLFVILIIGCGILIYKNFNRQETQAEKSLLESANPGSVKTDPVASTPPAPVPPLPEPDKAPAASQDLAKDKPKAEKYEKPEEIQIMPKQQEPGKREPEVPEPPAQKEPAIEESQEKEPKAPEIVKAPEKAVPAATNKPMTKKDFIEEVSNLSPVQEKRKPAVEKNVSQMNKGLITVVHLTNGSQLEGKVKEQNEQFIILENEGAFLEIQTKEISRMEEIPLEEFEDRKKSENTVDEPKFISGQEVIIMTYDDRVLQGSLIKIDTENVTLLLDEGTFIIKRKNIRMIEKK